MDSSIPSDFAGFFDEREMHGLASFDRFLLGRIDRSSVAWNNCSDDPPDAWLDLDGARYAVEVTSTPIRAGIGIWDERPPLESWVLAAAQLAEEIECQAKSGGVLRGLYGISFKPSAALTGDSFREMKRDVKRAALDYVRQTQNLSTSRVRDLLFARRHICSIGKFGLGRDHVAFTMIGVESSGETASSAAEYLEQALARKVSRLTAKRITSPWIIVLVNTDVFADQLPDLLRAAVGSSDILSRVHSVFVSWGDGSGDMLHSVNPRWLEADFTPPT